MTAALTVLGILAGLFLLILVIFIVLYNGLVEFREAVKKSLADIDVQLRQRLDMIPQLVDAVKGAMSYEQETLTEVIKARNEALSSLNRINDANRAGAPVDQKMFDDLAAKSTILQTGLGSLRAVVERYPELKAVEAIRALMENITTIENKINFTRSHYNQTVQDYETKRSSIPSCVVAIVLPLKFPTYGYYSDAQKEELNKAPKIQL